MTVTTKTTKVVRIEAIRACRCAWQVRYEGTDKWRDTTLGERPDIDLLIARCERLPLNTFNNNVGLQADAVSDMHPEDSHADNVRNAWCIASLAAGTVDRRVRAGRPVADVADSLTQLRDSLSRIDLLTRGVGPEDDGPVQAIASARTLRGCAFGVTEARTSKGPEWWAGFATAGEPFAVSEVSREDAVTKARAFMAAHGWRDDMGAEVGLLLVRQYERGRDDESAARGGIRIHDAEEMP